MGSVVYLITTLAFFYLTLCLQRRVDQQASIHLHTMTTDAK